MKKLIEKLETMYEQSKYNPTYWGNRGKYQKDYDALYDKLVPASGRAKTSHGELLRAISRIYYDIYNNGFGNGPFTKEWATIEDWASELKKHGGGAALKEVNSLMRRTNLGEYVLGSDVEDQGITDEISDAEAEALDKLVDAIILTVKAAEEE